MATLLSTAGFADTLDFDSSQFQTVPEIQSETTSYRYFGVGVGPLLLPLPNAFVGIRSQTGHAGFDLGAGVATAGILTHVKGFANVLWYPSPSEQGQFYTGLGVAGGPWITYEGDTTFTGAGNIILGKEFSHEKSKSFFQADLAYPSFIMGQVNYIMPFVTLSYAWCF